MHIPSTKHLIDTLISYREGLKRKIEAIDELLAELSEETSSGEESRNFGETSDRRRIREAAQARARQWARETFG